MDQYIIGPPKTVTVDTTIGLLSADIVPTSGKYEGMKAEVATIQAIGALYVQTDGSDADATGWPMAATDILTIEGYQNIKNLRFVKKTGATSLVWLPSYR